PNDAMRSSRHDYRCCPLAGIDCSRALLTKIAAEHISQVHCGAGGYPIGLTDVAKRQGEGPDRGRELGRGEGGSVSRDWAEPRRKRQRFARCPRCQAPGETPTTSLKTREKWLCSANPVAREISANDDLPSLSNSCASWMRRFICHLCGAMPMDNLNA